MLQQSLIGGKFFAVMFWLIADGLFAAACRRRRLLAARLPFTPTTLITVATVARKMLQQLFFYDAATTAAAAVAAKTLTVNCGMPSLLDLMSVHFVRLKHVHEAVKGGRKRREYIHV